MPKKKLSAEQQNEIIAMVKQNIPYPQVVKYLYDKHGIKITTMTVSNVVRGFKKFLAQQLPAERQEEIADLETPIEKMLKEAVQIYQKIMSDLKLNINTFNSRKEDVRLFNDVVDRLSRLRQILSAENVFKKEVSFIQKAQNEYSAGKEK